MENKTIEINKRIANFMGYTYYPHNHPELKNSQDAGWKISPEVSSSHKMNRAMLKFPENAYLCRNHNGLQYHSSWEQLMPVIQKIERLGYTSFIEKNTDGEHQVKFKSEQKEICIKHHYKLTAAWLAVDNFIQETTNVIEKNNDWMDLIFSRIIKIEDDGVILECEMDKDIYQDRVFQKGLFAPEDMIVGKVFTILMTTKPGKSEISLEEFYDEKVIKEHFPKALIIEDPIVKNLEKYFDCMFGNKLTLEKVMNMPNLQDVCDYHNKSKEEVVQILIEYLKTKNE